MPDTTNYSKFEFEIFEDDASYYNQGWWENEFQEAQNCFVAMIEADMNISYNGSQDQESYSNYTKIINQDDFIIDLASYNPDELRFERIRPSFYDEEIKNYNNQVFYIHFKTIDECFKIRIYYGNEEELQAIQVLKEFYRQQNRIVKDFSKLFTQFKRKCFKAEKYGLYECRASDNESEEDD